MIVKSFFVLKPLLKQNIIQKRYCATNYKINGYFNLFKISLGMVGFISLPIYSYKNNLNNLSENDSLIKKFIIYSLYSNVGAFMGFYLPNIVLLSPFVTFFLSPLLIPFGLVELFSYVKGRWQNNISK